MDMKCTVCPKEFTSNWKHAKYCSQKCRNEAWNGVTGRGGFNKGISSGTVGAMSELIASTYLLKEGWHVFRALSPAAFCDLIAFKENEETMLVEVRTGYQGLNGKLSFPKKCNKSVTHYAIVVMNKEAKTIIQPL